MNERNERATTSSPLQTACEALYLAALLLAVALTALL